MVLGHGLAVSGNLPLVHLAFLASNTPLLHCWQCQPPTTNDVMQSTRMETIIEVMQKNKHMSKTTEAITETAYQSSDKTRRDQHANSCKEQTRSDLCLPIPCGELWGGMRLVMMDQQDDAKTKNAPATLPLCSNVLPLANICSANTTINLLVCQEKQNA